MTEPCMFPNLHEPFYCRIHADVRLRLADERCRRGVTLTQPQPVCADCGRTEAEIVAGVTQPQPDTASRVPSVRESPYLDTDALYRALIAVENHGAPIVATDYLAIAAAYAALRSTPAAPKEDDR